MSNNKKPVTVAIGAALAGGLVLSGSTFAMQPLAQGYMLAAASVAGDDKAAAEGSCGMEKMDSDKDGRISKGEFAVAHDNDDSKFAAHDPDSDGFISAEEMKAHHAAKAGEGKCGEGKCGGDMKQAGDAKVEGAKADAEGKCGEGKCGEGKCGSK
jgi:uncharacterized low-complexity protein